MRILRLFDPARGQPAPGADVVVLDVQGLSWVRLPLPHHAEVADEVGPRSTHDRGASFEAPLRGAPQGEEGESFRSRYNRDVGGRSLYVRVSPLSSEAIDQELRWAMASGAAGIVLPRAVGRADIERLGAKLAVAEAEAGITDGAIRILAVVGDSPAGALAATGLRPNSRLAGLAHDPASLAAASGCDQRAPAVTQAGAMVVLAAAACGVEAVLVANSEDDEAIAAAERAGFQALLVTA